MDANRDLNVWALAQSCRRLSAIAEELTKNRRTFDVSQVQEIGRLVARAHELIEAGPAPTAERAAGAGRKGLGGLLARVLKGAEPEPEPQLQAIGDKPPSPSHRLGLRGHDQLIPTPDLVTFLAAQRKVGVLEVITETELFVLEFDNGDIVHAQSNRTPEGQRLGDILVSRNSVEREVLEQVVKTAPKGRLGEALVTLNLVTQEQFLGALREQIQCLFERLFEQPATRFSFWSGPPIHADSHMRLNATALLLDGARAFDETHWVARLGSEPAGVEAPGPMPASAAAEPAPAAAGEATPEPR